MNLSVTNLVSWIGSCERWWLWSQTYVPRGEVSSFWLGSGIHEALASYYSSYQGDEDLARGAYSNWVAESLHTLEAKLSPVVWPSISEAFLQQTELGSKMLDYYFIYDRARPLPGKVRHVEQLLSSTLPSGDTLRGRIDLILETDSGGLVVVDHKTYSSYTRDSLVELDQQLTAYAWLVYRTFGMMPEKIILNVLYRRAPEPPAVLRSGALSRSKSQPTTYELYLHEIRRLGFDERDYVDVLEALRRDTDAFIHRVETFRTQRELTVFEDRASAVLRRITEMGSSIDNAVAMPSFTQCRSCPYQAPCLARDRGDDWEWLLESGFSTERLL